MAVEAGGGEDDVWIFDFAREILSRLTFVPLDDGYPVWSADGERIAFTSGREIDWKASNNTGCVEQLAEKLGEGTPNRPCDSSIDVKFHL